MSSSVDIASTTSGWSLSRRLRTRIGLGLTISLLLHGLLLSLQFGVAGLGLPGLALPWNERRAPASELSIRLANVKTALDAARQSRVDGVPIPVAAPLPTEPIAEPPPVSQQTPPVPEPLPAAPASGGMQATLAPAAPTSPTPREMAPVPAAEHNANAQPKAMPHVITQSQPDDDSFAVRAPTPAEPEQQNTAQADMSKPPSDAADRPAVPDATPPKPVDLAAQKRAQEEQARQIQLADAKKQQDEARRAEQKLELDAQKRTEQADQAAQKLAAEETAHRTQQLEAKKLEETKRQAEAQAARTALEIDVQKKAEQAEAARRQAAAQALQKQQEKQADELAAKAQAQTDAQAKAQELANREKAEAAAQQKALERSAADKQAADAANADAVSAAAADNGKPGAIAALPKNLFGGGLAGRALDQARKLDTPRADTQLARPSLDSSGDLRRRSIFGSNDHDIGLTMYMESWRLKIERNGRLNYVQSASEKARGDAVVTVAIRSDGSVEDVVINRPSGSAELDEAVRNIVKLNARYSTFPPALARRYDVIEIRRVWSFGEKLRLIEEIR